MPSAAQDEPRQVPGADPAQGRNLIAAHGCGACHVIPGLASARGRVGPDLSGFARRAYIAGLAPNQPEALTAFLENPVALSPQTAMPASGLSAEEARDIAAYLYEATQ